MKRTPSQRRAKWCSDYKKATSFEPLMDDFIAGNETFQQAAEASIEWFRDYFEESMRAIPRIPK